MLTGFAGYSGNRGGVVVGVEWRGREGREAGGHGYCIGGCCKVMGDQGEGVGRVCKVCVCRKEREGGRRGEVWGLGGLSAPRRQPLNPCRPEWWCLS